MIARGEVWWTSLPTPEGSEPGYRRPVLVVQSDAFNQSRLQTVIVAAITSNVRLVDAPGNVRLRRRDSRLQRESVVNVSQLFTLDRHFLTERVGRLPPAVLAEVEDGLRLVLSV